MARFSQYFPSPTYCPVTLAQSSLNLNKIGHKLFPKKSQIFKVIKPWVVDKQAGLPKKDLTHLNKIGHKLFPNKSQIFKVRKPKILPFKNTINKASRDILWVVDK